MVESTEPAKHYMPKTPSEKVAECKRLKEEGNQFFKDKNYIKARGCYGRIELHSKPFLEDIDASGADVEDFSLGMVSKAAGTENSTNLTAAEKKELKEICVAAYNNNAQCWNKADIPAEKKFLKVIEKANLGLAVTPTYKGFFIRATARGALKDYEGAVSDVREALKINPDDPNKYKDQMNKWQELEDHSRKASDNALRKAMKKGMFGAEEPFNDEEQLPVKET